MKTYSYELSFIINVNAESQEEADIKLDKILNNDLDDSKVNWKINSKDLIDVVNELNE